MNRDDIIQANPIDRVVRSYGHDLIKVGTEFATVCPFHQDKKPSLRINVAKQTWYCDPCAVGGSVIDFVSKRDNISIADAMTKLGGASGKNGSDKVEVASYDYTDENGELLYQVKRYLPKTFRQRHKDSSGAWVWNMEGVRRVPYRLQSVMASEDLFIVEGEKDADNLHKLGFTATCNVGGAKKWLDSYSEFFRKKNVILIPDDDEPGRDHMKQVTKSLTGIARLVFVWTCGFKDISDFIAAQTDPKQAILESISKLQPLNLCADIPVQSMSDLESEYVESLKRSESVQLSFSRWLPKLGAMVRPLVAGEMAVIAADTGVGKTAIIQNIAFHAAPMPTLIFELELPGSLMFERFVQLERGMSGWEVAAAYKQGQPPDWKSGGRMDHVFSCTKSGLKPSDLETIINQSELKIGDRPGLVIIDYIGLLSGQGHNRYEKLSDIAESMKVLAKKTKTIVVLCSQVKRPDDKRKSNDVGLHDAKDSGAIESSAGLVLGAWKEQDNLMKIKILKNTKGKSGAVIDCDCRLETMTIEQAKAPENDYDWSRANDI